MPFLGVYSWSQYTTPAGIPAGDLTGDTQPNDPASPNYSSSAPSWIGETFTFNGEAPTQIDIDDDDGLFEDGYVETGGPQTLATAVTIGGTTYPAGSVVENEFSLLEGTQEIYVVRINGENVGFSYAVGEEPTSGETFTATEGRDGDPVDNAGGAASSSEPYNDMVCFAAGTMIRTPTGDCRVETLLPGDLVTTADAGEQPVLWCGKSAVELAASSDNVRPVLISEGSLGNGLPNSDLVVSQQHRMLVFHNEASVQSEPGDVFVSAKGLLPLKGVRVMYGKKTLIYVHLLLPSHEVIFAEGAPTESFYPGPTALKMMSQAQLGEVLAACPELRRDPEHGFGPMARDSLSLRQTLNWARERRDRVSRYAAFGYSVAGSSIVGATLQ